MSFDDMLLGALRDSQRPQDASARLATVATVTASGVTVLFDGESAVSPRTYRVLQERPIAGSRVVMLRAGSSWVCAGNVASPRSAAGTVFVAGPTASVNITYPAGRFLTIPWPQVTASATANVAVIANLQNLTTTGFTAFLYGVNAAWTSGALNLFWSASEPG